MSRHTVLVCDNEAVMRALVRATLEPVYEVIEAGGGDEALALLEQGGTDLLLLDMMMPGRTGLEVVAELRAAGKDTAGGDGDGAGAGRRSRPGGGRRRGPISLEAVQPCRARGAVEELLA